MVIKNVHPVWSRKFRKLAITSHAIALSKPEVGSSRNMHLGEHSSAHATAVRFISPPDTPRIRRLPTYVSAQRFRLSCAMTRETRARFSRMSSAFEQHTNAPLEPSRFESFGSLAIAANMMVSRTVAPPKKQSCCWMYAVSFLTTLVLGTTPSKRASPKTLPSVLRRLKISSSVVLPAPLGPITAHMSPG